MRMRKKPVVKRRHVSHSRKPKHFHHRVISFFKGDGGIYVIFIMATVMAGAFALSGGILPSLSQNPTAADQVEIDEESAKQSSTSALQLVDIKIKPTATPTPTAGITPGITITNSVTLSITPPTVQECYNKTLVSLLLDYSSSMLSPDENPKYQALNSALGSFYTELSKYNNAAIGAQAFAGKTSGNTSLDGVVNLLNYKLVKNITASDKSKITSVDINVLNNSYGGGTYMRNGFTSTIAKLKSAPLAYVDYKKVTIVFSDGIPEETYDDRESHGDPNSSSVCLGTGRYNERCFAKFQDPRTDLTNSLKLNTDSVYVVGIYDSSSGEGQVFKNDLTSLLQAIAEKNQSPYYQFIDLKGDTSSALKQLKPAFQNIFKDVCK
jgi:hypothetical protein